MTPELFAAQGLERIPEGGPLTITVAGAVDGWFEALEGFGKVAAESIFAPGIGYGEEGMPVTSKLSGWLSQAAEPVLKRWESSAGVYLPGYRVPRTGEVLRQPHLARTYRLLAREGRDAFYRGPIGRTITDYVQRVGGVLSMEDMQRHHSDWVEPISTNYRGYDGYEFPTNSQSVATLDMFTII